MLRNGRTEGRFFYGMPESGASQWIYTHPEEGAPRTGEGIFPMEVVEVVQVGGWVGVASRHRRSFGWLIS